MNRANSVDSMTAHLQKNVPLHPSQFQQFNNLALMRLQQIATEEAKKNKLQSPIPAQGWSLPFNKQHKNVQNGLNFRL